MSALPPDRKGSSYAPRSIETMKLLAKCVSIIHDISYGQALDRVARESGFRDWNTACARTPRSTTATPTKMRNRVIVQIVLEYRQSDCLRSPAGIIDQFRRDHPGVICNEDYLTEVAAMNVIDLALLADRHNRWCSLDAEAIDFLRDRLDFSRERDEAEKQTARDTFRYLMNGIHVKAFGSFILFKSRDGESVLKRPIKLNARINGELR